MAISSHPQYESASYQACRPRYKASLVDAIVIYHQQDNPQPATDLGVDVATGTGIFARRLATRFTKVIGTDISASMLEAARAASSEHPNIEYIEAASEHLAAINDHSVDVLTAATSAHWFDPEKFLREAQRVLKPNGTLAIIGYNGFLHFVDYPQCDKVSVSHCIGFNKLKPDLGQDSGYNLVAKMYRPYHRILARAKWTGIQRRIYPGTIEDEPLPDAPPIVSPEPVVVEFEATWRKLRDVYQTMSGVVQYVQSHPNEENPADVAVRDLMATAGATDLDEKLRVQFGEVLLLCHPPQPNA